jgi:hypothetical protein
MCSENYDGSSKGMEATGAEKVVLDFFGDKKTGSYIKMLVRNDDFALCCSRVRLQSKMVDVKV